MRTCALFASALLFAICTQTAHAECSVSAVNLNFGAYNPLRPGHSDTIGNIAVTCTGKPGDPVSYTIALSAGGDGAFTRRRMRGQTEHALHYNLYTTASRTMVWGDGNQGSVVVSDAFVQTSARVTRNYPVYARVFGAQNIRIGNYNDVIVVTLNY